MTSTHFRRQVDKGFSSPIGMSKPQIYQFVSKYPLSLTHTDNSLVLKTVRRSPLDIKRETSKFLVTPPGLGQPFLRKTTLLGLTQDRLAQTRVTRRRQVPVRLLIYKRHRGFAKTKTLVVVKDEITVLPKFTL